MRENTVQPDSIAMDSCENGTAIVLHDLTKSELRKRERHMSYKIRIFLLLFFFFYLVTVWGEENGTGKWGKYYATLQSLFPPMSQMRIF